MNPESRRRALFVTVSESVELGPEVAFVSGALKSAGLETFRVATDFCTSEAEVLAKVSELAPEIVLFPIVSEHVELAIHLSGLLGAKSDAPKMAIFGDALNPELALAFPPGVLRTQHGEELFPFLGLGKIPSLRSVPLDLGVFGGKDVISRPFAASLFGELGTLGLLAGRGRRVTASPVALLSRLEAPVADGPWSFTPEVALAPFRSLGTLPTRIEWWDREGPGAAHLLAAKQEGVRQSVRLSRAPSTMEDFLRLRSQGVDRVILDVDRLDGVRPLPSSHRSAVESIEVAALARRAGLEIGFLVVIGLPGETRSTGIDRVQKLREFAPERVRCIPFEPTGSHPGLVAAQEFGMRPPDENRWIREVHQPWTQDSLPPEDFIRNWADALDLLAFTERNRCGAQK